MLCGSSHAPATGTVSVRESPGSTLGSVAGMLSTDNFGKNYRDSFDSIYPSLSAKYDVVFYPFFLENVALVPWFNQNDGIHPNKDGVKLIVSQIIPFVRTLINRINEGTLESEFSFDDFYKQKEIIKQIQKLPTYYKSVSMFLL